MKLSRNGLPLYEVGVDSKPVREQPAASSGVTGPQLSGGGFGGSGGAQIPGGGGTSEMTFGPTGSGITLTPGSGVQSLGAGAAGQAAALDALKPGTTPSGTGLPVANQGGINLTPGAGVTSLGAGPAGQLAALDAIKPGAGGRTSNSGLPLAPTMESITDKLEQIRELGDMARDGSVRRVRSVVRMGGALGRFARSLLK